VRGPSKFGRASSLRGPSRGARRIAVAPIRAYQRVLSPGIPARCKYHPSCSAYAVQAIETYGILRGSVLAAWRLLRCNPFSHGGYDPVSAQTLFSRHSRTPDSTHS
jgi:putative membrane protein insertion efficiency factor